MLAGHILDISIDYWVVKINAQGNLIWNKTFGGSQYDNLQSLISTADGGYLLGGTSISNASADKSKDSKGEEDYWLVKIDDVGKKLWDKTIGGNESDFLKRVIVTIDRNYLLAGDT